MVVRLSYLTVPFVADGSSQLLLTLRSFPKAVSVKVDARATGVLWRPATEYGVAVVSPAVVDPFLKVKINTLHAAKVSDPNQMRAASLTSSLKSPIHMGVFARLTFTVRTDCMKVSATLASSMPRLRHCSMASNQVRFWRNSRNVWSLTVKGSGEMYGSSTLSEMT